MQRHKLLDLLANESGFQTADPYFMGTRIGEHRRDTREMKKLMHMHGAPRLGQPAMDSRSCSSAATIQNTDYNAWPDRHRHGAVYLFWANNTKGIAWAC